MSRFGDVDIDRLAFLLIAVTDLSDGGYVLIRSAMERSLWRINVRAKGVEHTATAKSEKPKDRWPSLMLALDRAMQWLAAARKDPR